ncbi:flagellar hook-basal body complex protein [Erythrobacteraceae bacterium CFH 75059]|uniref:flagellar basal body rod protein FlgF n=1 Tax=Qipengyuania thermophila TaxID=2509361 RepID=UPI00101FECA3|nr:flagellar basal body rod protein FlgF [Qipengyuania thermophila]TCD06289.1 flagellar hook-basal body complex protein [Erythrobacteraceae bacterium CFH 75059]
MDRMIYTALSGLDAAMNRQRVIAHNLANAQTPGFRADGFATAVLTVRGAGVEARALAKGALAGVDLVAGTLVATGDPLHAAVKGDALIALQGKDGAEVYSRRGDLSVGATGVLQNGDGLPVLGREGPITVPPGQPVRIEPDGTVRSADASASGAQPEAFGRIKLASPAGSRILKDQDGMLRVPDGILPTDETATLETGMLEQSNVDLTTVLVDMIEAQRGFERRAKLFATAGDIDQAGSQLLSLRP